MISLDAMPVPLGGADGGFSWVNKQDLDAAIAIRWHRHKVGKNAYARTGSPGKRTRLHTLVAARMGIGSEHRIDHADRDGLNNTRANLRPATRSGNAANIAARGREGIKGAYTKFTRSGALVWIVELQHQGKKISLGKFYTPEAAALAYDQKAKELHGEFAYQNNFGPAAMAAIRERAIAELRKARDRIDAQMASITAGGGSP